MLGRAPRARRLDAPERLHRAPQSRLDGRGAGQAAAGGHGAGECEVKARWLATALGNLVGHATNERGRGAAFLFAGLERVERKLEGGIALRGHAHDVRAVGAREPSTETSSAAAMTWPPSWSVWLPAISERPGAWT